MISKKKLSGEQGATVAEFALATTMFFLLVFGGIQFARGIYQYNIISNASKAGARWAAVRGSSSGQTAATDSAIDVYIQSQLYGITAVDSVSRSPDTNPGSTVQIIVRGSYSPNIPFFSSRTLTLRSVSQMIILR